MPATTGVESKLWCGEMVCAGCVNGTSSLGAVSTRCHHQNPGSRCTRSCRLRVRHDSCRPCRRSEPDPAGNPSLLELAGDVAVVAEASDGEEGIAVIRRERPDVVLLDLRMPRKDGVEVLKTLQSEGALPPTIILTTFDDDAALLEAVRAGAKGYLLKDVSLEHLTAAIKDVAGDATVIRPVVTERVLRGLEHIRRDFDALSPPDPLTRREIEILRLMAGGYSNREIADALGSAEGTVKITPPASSRSSAFVTAHGQS